MTLDDTDRVILNRLQEGFPVAPHPYKKVARELGIEETDLLERLAGMKERGIITRFGPFFDAVAIGGAFCLCAIAVPPEQFESVLIKVNAHEEVAHNYERTHQLNMWFVLATETQEEIAEVVADLERETELKVHCFPKLQEFFVGFRIAA